MQNTNKDSEDFYPTWDLQIEKDSYAIVMGAESFKTSPIEDLNQPKISWDYLNIIKIDVLNNNPSKQIFMGIAREQDIDAYLSGVEYDEVTDLHDFPIRMDFQNHIGSGMPRDPTIQTFWIESYYGAQTQTLIWKPEPDHSLVLMNEDKAFGVDLNIVLWVKIALFHIGSILHFGVGVLVLLISILTISFSTGRFRNVVYPAPFK
ncbi:hypothetical protein ACFLUJ_07370 [Chloroflexota bacterium]